MRHKQFPTFASFYSLAGQWSYCIHGQLEKRRHEIKNPVLLAANGVNGQLELLTDKIRIKRNGTLAFLGHGMKGDKEIELKSISSIQFRTPGSMTNGYIQFAFLGGQETKAALWQATQDENTVMFSASQLPSFLQMKNAIESQKAMVLAQTSTMQPPVQQVIAPRSDLE